jgi:glycosyltransferase involved in cell wall biosynthesis
MKILIIGSKEYPIGSNTDDPLPSGGIEFYVQAFVKHLTGAQKTNILLVTRRFSGSSIHERKGNIEIFRVPWIKGFFLRNISFNLMTFFTAIKLDFDLVHAHGPIASFFGVILSKIKKAPLIATPHGLALKQPQYNRAIKKFFSTLEKTTYSRINHVVFLSEEEKMEFNEKLGFLPERYTIIHPGVNIARFSSGEGQKIREEFLIGERSVITFIGRLIGVKGIRYLIEATVDLNGDFLLLIVGDGPQKKELIAMVSKSKLENVIFTGQRYDIPDILSATDVFVLPSLSEGLPIALLEALAAGKACVVTDIGLPLKDRMDALVVKARDSEELRRAIKEILVSEDLKIRLGYKAKMKAINEFSWKKSIDEHLKLIEEVTYKL